MSREEPDEARPCLASVAQPIASPGTGEESRRLIKHPREALRLGGCAAKAELFSTSISGTPCSTCDPAREARMKHRIHEGILYQDKHKRYCLYELGVPEYKMLTCTSGCRLEVWLNRAWVAGHVEGDGEDYWLFADAGGRFLLAEQMIARYTEHYWRSNMRDISGICSSSSISLM